MYFVHAKLILCLHPFHISGIIGMDCYVYAVGGYDSNCQLRTVERYCTVSNKWEFVCPMKSPRSALSVAVLGGKLYALGNCLNILINI